MGLGRSGCRVMQRVCGKAKFLVILYLVVSGIEYYRVRWYLHPRAAFPSRWDLVFLVDVRQVWPEAGSTLKPFSGNGVTS